MNYLHWKRFSSSDIFLVSTGFTDFIGCENGTITTTATTEVEGNGTDFEYLLDHVDAEDNQILVEEVDANGYSQIRKANLMELMVAGQIQE